MPDLQHAATCDQGPGQWSGSIVSADLTHHLRDGNPLYGQRFHAVQKFHAPGLAPVLDQTGAYHIRPCGEQAYLERFRQTWGFYDGKAAVEAEDGWLHILSDGSPLSSKRFSWCGNFREERCPVRFDDGSYGHIKAEGLPAYDARHLYAGDFRDGIAVVRYRSDGLCGHIDASGSIVHSHRYLDLDVFHKGYARAKDGSGWFHINALGEPITQDRYAEIEPFYNGQARAVTHDGEYRIIDERSQVRASVGRDPQDRFHKLSADLVGFWRTDTISAAVSFGVFECLPALSVELARQLGLPEEPLSRLLGGLWDLGLVEHGGEGQWQATARGQLLDRRSAIHLADAALEFGGPVRQQWGHLVNAIKSRAWRPPDVFAVAASDCARPAQMQSMLAAYAEHDYGGIVDRLPFGGARTIVDMAGGTGVLARLLSRRFPSSRVCVVERPEVCELAQHGNGSGGVHFVNGDLFHTWPVQADAFVMSRVLHDWNDDDAVRILRQARASLAPGGTGGLIELLLDESSPYGRLCDLHLMVMSGGRERAPEEFSELLTQAGFTLTRIDRMDALVGLLVVKAT